LPGFDGTGPMGRGPFTGRGMGFCVVRLPDETKGSASGDEAVTHPNGKEVSAMPWGDGTGPLGLGPMTGRAAGFCAGYPVPGYMNPFGGSAVWARGAYPAPAPAYGYAGPAGVARPYPAYAAGFVPAWGRPFGRWFGRGFGRGRGRGRWFGPGRWWW